MAENYTEKVGETTKKQKKQIMHTSRGLLWKSYIDPIIVLVAQDQLEDARLKVLNMCQRTYVWQFNSGSP